MAVVLSIAPYKFLPPKNGGQKAIAFFAKYFSRHVQLIFATIKCNENEYAQEYKTVPIFSSSKLRYINPLYIFRLKNLVEKYRATHVLIEHPYMGWMAILVARLTASKLIVRSHNIESLRFKSIGKWWWKILWQYERFVHKQADFNFFIQENDKQYAITNFGLSPEKCFVLTYGIEISEPPLQNEIEMAKNYVRHEHNISPSDKILLFAAAFNYKPNFDAFEIIDKILAPLLAEKNFPFKILICGSGLDEKFATHPTVIITGFVDDISTYFKAADVFINPTLEGGGIKTKLVEAIAQNANAVSTKNGAIGIPHQLCNGKLVIVEDENWVGFAKSILAVSEVHAETPAEYYQHFNWDYNTIKAVKFIEVK